MQDTARSQTYHLDRLLHSPSDSVSAFFYAKHPLSLADSFHAWFLRAISWMRPTLQRWRWLSVLKSRPGLMKSRHGYHPLAPFLASWSFRHVSIVFAKLGFHVPRLTSASSESTHSSLQVCASHFSLNQEQLDAFHLRRTTRKVLFGVWRVIEAIYSGSSALNQPSTLDHSYWLGSGKLESNLSTHMGRCRSQA